MSSSVPVDPNPLSPLNRRISVLVLSRVGEERLVRGGEQPVPETQVYERMLRERENPAIEGIRVPKPAITN